VQTKKPQAEASPSLLAFAFQTPDNNRRLSPSRYNGFNPPSSREAIMRISAYRRQFLLRCLLASGLLAAASPPANAIPSFTSHDNRLPNPDRPYEMVGETVHFDSSPHFAIYDLDFSPSDPSELATPTQDSNGNWVFDSTFHINYKASVSFSTQPPHTVSGIGKVRARGLAPDPLATDRFRFPYAYVFDTELVELNLFALSPIPEVMFRESPTLQSTGRTIRQDACPLCAVVFPFWRISSFFDLNAEVTFNGGNTWTPARNALHLGQAPDGYPAGDYNHDKVVDTSDYIEWRRTLGNAGAGLSADGDWSGEVDEGDYNVWRSNFGLQTAASTSAPAFVPEPATLTPLILAVLVFLRPPR
jgi:hypothetical protein